MNNFRCYDSFRLKFKSGLNILCGPNASGKTTILEALYVLGLTRSYRTSNNSELIKIGSEDFFVRGALERENRTEFITLYNSFKAKKIKRNNEKVKSISDYLGTVNVVLFTPMDLTFFTTTPGNRRKEFDIFLCQLSKQYLNLTARYRKLLKERNVLLKDLGSHGSSKKETLLDVVTERLMNVGEKIIRFRERFVQKINPVATQKHFLISKGREKLQLKYFPSVKPEDYNKKIQSALTEDLKRGSTSVGPHRDDYLFFLNEKNIIEYGSQGQQRNTILSVKLALVELIYEVKKEYPIVLLDDVFSELDKERQNQLVKIFKTNVQTLITTATLSDIDAEAVKDANFIYLKRGGQLNE